MEVWVCYNDIFLDLPEVTIFTTRAAALKKMYEAIGQTVVELAADNVDSGNRTTDNTHYNWLKGPYIYGSPYGEDGEFEFCTDDGSARVFKTIINE